MLISFGKLFRYEYNKVVFLEQNYEENLIGIGNPI